MICPKCGIENDDTQKQCQVCGSPLTTETKKINKETGIIIGVVAVIIIIAIIGIASAIANSSKQKSVDDEWNSYSEDYTYNTEYTTGLETTVATTLSEKEATKQQALDYIKKADDALKNGEREGALQMADIAISLYDKDDIDEDIQKKYDEIYEYAPFNLYEYDNVLKIDWSKTNYYGNVFLYDRDCTSNTNKDYSHCILFETHTSYTEDHIDAYYNLAGKYNSLSGTILLPNDNKNTDQNNCYITIYGDGRKLYTSDDMISGCLEESFDIDVSGVETLVVSYHRDTDEYSEYAIADFVALKDLP